MSEDQERDQLGLWEKLNRLYGDKETGQYSQGTDADSSDSSADPDAGASGSAPSEINSADQIMAGPIPQTFTKKSAEHADAPVPPPRPGGGYRSPTRELGRVNETCSKCKRSCKQTGLKLNRMLCIGFLPLEG